MSNKLEIPGWRVSSLAEFLIGLLLLVAMLGGTIGGLLLIAIAAFTLAGFPS
jgi:hypothetical protein